MDACKTQGGRIRIRAVEPWEATGKPSTRGVRLEFKDLHNGTHMAALEDLFQRKGFRTKEGGQIGSTLFYRLCTWKEGWPVEPDEVLAILREDNESFDLTEANRRRDFA